MNAVMMMAYNTTPEQLELTKAAVESVFAQDVEGGVELWFVDNGSTDHTWDWMRAMHSRSDRKIFAWRYPNNESPVAVVNRIMEGVFFDNQHVLGCANDVVLPPNFYRELLRWPRGIVTASMTNVNPIEQIAVSDFDCPGVHESGEVVAVNECTPMAVALIRKWCHDALVAKDGYFLDGGYFHYASDCDMALRLAACGIRGVQLSLPYYHYGSASWRLAAEGKGKEQTDKADIDRDYFTRKWGFAVDDPRYGESAGNINFRGERRDV